MKRYRLLIFDMAGTLYDQRALRLRMVWEVGRYYFCHPRKWLDVAILLVFRWQRERQRFWSRQGVVFEQLQYEQTARFLSVPAERVRQVVRCWMFERPLRWLPDMGDAVLLAFLRRQPVGRLAIYSDYPAREKALCLGLTTPCIFASTDEVINAMKPSPQGIRVILEQMAAAPEDCLMVGDRDDRDGEAARCAGVDFLLLPQEKKMRRTVVAELVRTQE